MSNRKTKGYVLVDPNVRQEVEIDMGQGPSVGTQGVPSTIAAMSRVGTLLNTYTTAKSILNAEDVISLPANYFGVGKKLKVRVSGGLSNIVTTPGTITFQMMVGAVIAWTSGAIQLNATAHTLLPFILEFFLRCDSSGSGTAAKLLGMGEARGIQFTNTAAQTDGVNTSSIIQVPATAPAVGTGFDSTVAQKLDFFAGFSISNAGNGVQLYDYTVEEMN
jgi:hypothetical protein